MTARKLLVVEDDAAIAKGLRVMFERAHYQVELAYTGEAALELFEARRFELIVLDLMLPGISGLDVCRKIRAAPAYVPIIMLTAKDQLVDKLVGMELGADIYLPKPFDAQELLMHVRALFRMLDHRLTSAPAETGNAATFVCGPIVLHERERLVTKSGRQIALAPKEFELLREFMRQPERAFGRETLLALVWGYNHEGDSRTVDVHVQRLRAKLEDDPANARFLLTVRGFGYRLSGCEP